MADIHVLETDYSPANGAGHLRVIYHVPVNQDNNSYPGGQVSSIPAQLGAGEAAALADGSLYEQVVSRDWNFTAHPPAATQELARQDWHIVAAEVQARMDRTYRFYGLTLDRS